jgi:tetratricopeptide (TPR) repeat protein
LRVVHRSPFAPLTAEPFVRPCAALLAILLLAPAAQAQKPATVPVRPKLDAGADTNDARAYYQYGLRMVDSKPEASMRAFYWASRIDPASGEVLYALRTATLLNMSTSGMSSYFDHSAKKRSPENLALDSLLYRAYTVNPFLFRNLDGSVLKRLIEAEVVNDNPGIDRTELNYDILQYMHDVRHQGWMAYSQGRFPDALDYYAKQLKTLDDKKKGKNKKDDDDASEIHAARARIFYLMSNMDSALTEMTAAMTAMRARDAKETVVLYESKAMYEQSLGMIHEHANHPDAAREAYGQALTEDLSYYAAHSRMAQLELAQGDTAGALLELDLSVQLQPNDPVLRYAYAKALVVARRDGDAASQLMKAIAADSFYAAPHLLLARIADAEQYTDDAVTEYRRYMSVAAKSDPELPGTQGRIAKLSAVVATTPAKP